MRSYQAPNKQLQRTVRDKVPRHIVQCAAAELRRYAACLLATLGVAACATTPSEFETALKLCFSPDQSPGWSLIDAPPEAERLISIAYYPPKGTPTYWFGSADGQYTACWLPRNVDIANPDCSRRTYHFSPTGAGEWSVTPSEIVICDPPVRR
jgi:hypothetical protein